MSAYRYNHAISLVPADQISSMCITAGLNKTTGLTTETTIMTETTGLNETTAVTRPTAKPPS